VATQLRTQANYAYEIVVDGVDESAVAGAMTAAMQTIAGPGIVAIGAGNYGGKLGKFHFRLHELLKGAEPASS
jgi:formylmethanofuran--tetrahydromethanopterin N-formyltransferase